MPAKKRGPTMRQNQERKRTMQQIAKGGPQKSGVKKPAPAKAAGPARPSIGNVRGPAGRGRPDSAQAKDTKNWQKMNQLGSAKSAKAAEPKPRTPAPGTGNVLQSAIDRSKALKDAARQANRSRVATRDAARASGAKGAVAAVAGEAAKKVLGPVAKKAGAALANRVLKPAARKLDDAMPGVNSKDEAKRRNAAAAAKGSDSKFKGARDVAIKKASAIKGSPVVGPRKSFDDTFRDARKAGKKEFTWKGKKYNTKTK
jgi:hypothetical protein